MAEGQQGGDPGVRKYFFFIKGKVSSDWKDLAFHLGFEKADTDNIAGSNRDDKSCCMVLLEEWLKHNGGRATVEALMKALSKAKLQSTVDELKNEYPELGTPRTSGQQEEKKARKTEQMPPPLPILVEILAQVMPSVETPQEMISYASAKRLLIDVTAVTEETLHLLKQVKPKIKTPKDLLDTAKAIKALEEISGVSVISVKAGSLVFYLQCADLAGLGKLWFMYKSGELDKLLHGSLVSKETLQLLSAESITVRATIKVQDFRKVLVYLLTTSAVKAAGQSSRLHVPLEYPLYQPYSRTISNVLEVLHLDNKSLPRSSGEQHSQVPVQPEDSSDALVTTLGKLDIDKTAEQSPEQRAAIQPTEDPPTMTHPHVQIIQSSPTASSTVLSRPNEPYTAKQSTSQRSGQSGSPETGVFSKECEMKERHREILRRCPDIVRDLRAPELINELIATGIITTRQYEELERFAGDLEEQTAKLLDILVIGGPQAFQVFCEVLREVSPNLAHLLEGLPSWEQFIDYLGYILAKDTTLVTALISLLTTVERALMICLVAIDVVNWVHNERCSLEGILKTIALPLILHPSHNFLLFPVLASWFIAEKLDYLRAVTRFIRRAEDASRQGQEGGKSRGELGKAKECQRRYMKSVADALLLLVVLQTLAFLHAYYKHVYIGMEFRINILDEANVNGVLFCVGLFDVLVKVFVYGRYYRGRNPKMLLERFDVL